MLRKTEGRLHRLKYNNTIFSFAGAAIGFINVIWLFPFVLEAEQFGLTRVMISIGIIGARVASLGMGNVTLRFFPQFRNQEERHHGFLFLAVTVPLAGFLLLSLAGWLLQSPVIQFYSDKSSLFGDYYTLLFPLLFFILYFNILESYIRSLFDTVAATFLQDILLRFFHTAVILIYYFGFITFGTFMWLYVLSYGLQLILLLVYTGSKHQLYLIPDLHAFTRDRLKKMGNYALFAVIGSVAVITLGNIDMLMIGGLTNLTETAVYAVSFYLATLIKIPSRGLGKISQPIIAESHHKNDLATISGIYKKSSINQLVVGGTIFLLIWTNIDHIYRFLPETYHAGRYVFLFVGIGKMIDMLSGFNGTIIRTSQWYRFDLYAMILLLLLTVITNLLLIPVYGITGAAMATALSIFLYNTTCFYYIRHRFKIQPFTGKTVIALILLAGTLFAVTLVPTLPHWFLDFVVRVILVSGIITTGILTLKLSEDLEQFIRDTFSYLHGKSE